MIRIGFKQMRRELSYKIRRERNERAFIIWSLPARGSDGDVMLLLLDGMPDDWPKYVIQVVRWWYYSIVNYRTNSITSAVSVTRQVSYGRTDSPVYLALLAEATQCRWVEGDWRMYSLLIAWTPGCCVKKNGNINSLLERKTVFAIFLE